MQRPSALQKAERIRQLNDSFRQTFVGGVVLITAGVEHLAPVVRAETLHRVRAFDSFDMGSDPHGEHDFGSFDLAGQKIFWKIDYYDSAVQYGSEDPADPGVTTRVLTVMLAAEY